MLPKPPASVVPWVNSRENPLKGGKILVIDDEPMVREAVGRVLANEGYAVTFAYDGNDALAKLAADPPDAILLDLMMPGMNGRQFLSALRTDLNLDLPVVVMTAVHGLGQRAISLGATDVVEKPFDVDELLNKMALVLFRARRTEPPLLVRDLPTDPDPGHDRAVVVVVDPDVAALDRLDTRLSAAGFTVVAVPEAREGLPRLIRALAPAALVVAVDGTGDGGRGLVTQLRATPGLERIPLVAFTRTADARTAVAAPVSRSAVVTLSRAIDDDLVRTVEAISGAAGA